MKNFLITALILLTVLSSMTGCNSSESPETEAKSPVTTETEAKIPEKTSEKKNKITFNDEFLNVFGKTYQEIKTIYGNANGATWYNGILFSFEDDLFLAFAEENDESVKEPQDSSVCHASFGYLKHLINGLEDKNYTCKELSEALSIDISDDGMNDMEEEYSYSFSYNDLFVIIYSESHNCINQASDVLIKMM